MSAEEAGVKEVRMILESWPKFYKSRDFASIAALYAESSIYIAPGAPPLHGREGIYKALNNLQSSGVTDTELQDQSIEQLADDVVITTGNGTLIWRETNQRRNFTDVTVWKKFPDGKWRCVRDIFNYRI